MGINVIVICFLNNFSELLTYDIWLIVPYQVAPWPDTFGGHQQASGITQTQFLR